MNYAMCKDQSQKLHILYDSISITFLEWIQTRNEGQMSGCQGLRIGGEEMGGREVDVTIKGKHRDPFVDKIILYLDYQFQTLVVILHYSFARCLTLEEISKGY